jgi:hypothetical protein
MTNPGDDICHSFAYEPMCAGRTALDLIVERMQDVE